MNLIAKRIASAAAAALFILPVGAGVATATPDRPGGIASASNDRGYEWYCDRNSRGWDWDYCWSHYKDRWQREHNGGDKGDHRGGGNGNGGNGGRGW